MWRKELKLWPDNLTSLLRGYLYSGQDDSEKTRKWPPKSGPEEGDTGPLEKIQHHCDLQSSAQLAAVLRSIVWAKKTVPIFQDHLSLVGLASARMCPSNSYLKIPTRKKYIFLILENPRNESTYKQFPSSWPTQVFCLSIHWTLVGLSGGV